MSSDINDWTVFLKLDLIYFPAGLHRGGRRMLLKSLISGAVLILVTLYFYHSRK